MRELSSEPESEREELAQVYVVRGVEAGLAREVAKQLMSKDALGAHARRAPVARHLAGSDPRHGPPGKHGVWKWGLDTVGQAAW